MREITLYPGESITIGDTIIKCAVRGDQFVGTPFMPPNDGRTVPIPAPTPTPAPQAIPSAPSPYTVWCEAQKRAGGSLDSTGRTLMMAEERAAGALPAVGRP